MASHRVTALDSVGRVSSGGSITAQWGIVHVPSFFSFLPVLGPARGITACNRKTTGGPPSLALSPVEILLSADAQANVHLRAPDRARQVNVDKALKHQGFCTQPNHISSISPNYNHWFAPILAI
jgi:hypothetical protein